MIFDVEQISKDLFAADFIIKRGIVDVGRITVEGKLGSREAKIEGTFYGYSFKMEYYKHPRNSYKTGFRPYIISDNFLKTGIICQAERKFGMFKGYSFRELIFDSTTYEMYSLGMGEEGYKSPIYCRESQIAQIDKGCIVYNQLHNYKLYAEDEKSARMAVLFCIYFYISGVYTPGEKEIKSKTKYIAYTKNKYLFEKYNPEFISKIQP